MTTKELMKLSLSRAESADVLGQITPEQFDYYVWHWRNDCPRYGTEYSYLEEVPEPPRPEDYDE